ncbi:unnamed protein product [Camellia sinensis]
MASSRTQSVILKSPSASRIADSQCYRQYTASLKCLEESNSDKSKGHEQFDIYKECKKKENHCFKFPKSKAFHKLWYHGKLDWSAIGIVPYSHEVFGLCQSIL